MEGAMGGPGGEGDVAGGGIDKRPGANVLVPPKRGVGVTGPGPGKGSLTGGGLPRTTADLAPAPMVVPVVPLDDPQLQALASKVRDPNLPALTRDLSTMLGLFTKLRATKSQDTSFEVKGKEREQLVDTIAAVRGGLAALDGTNADAAAFTVAVHHKLEEVSPYLFQLNINAIESVEKWSTCNLTSLAMALEVLGKRATAYPADKTPALLEVAKVFKNDIADARLASNGTGTSLAALQGLRFPDFLEIAAIVEFLATSTPTHDQIIEAAKKAVLAKPHPWF
jgi:hypothetical protein